MIKIPKLYLGRIQKAEKENAWERLGKAPGNSHGSTGSARAWHSLARVLPTEGAVSLTYAGFPPGFAKSFPSFSPTAICYFTYEGCSHSKIQQSSHLKDSLLTTQCTRMLRGIQNSKEKTSTEPTILSARNFPVKPVQMCQLPAKYCFISTHTSMPPSCSHCSGK